MANPFSNDVTVINYFSVVASVCFDPANLFIIILNSKVFSKYAHIYLQSFCDVPALL